MYAITYLPLKNIVFSESNPRKEINPDELQELSLSISQQGILQPVLVRTKGKKYELVCGARRTHAANLAKLKEIPAIIREMTDEEAFEAQITENLQRKDVHPLEESEAYLRLQSEMKYTPQGISEKLGKHITYIAQRLKLADLIEPFKDLYRKDVIGLGHALEICKLNPDDQQDYFNDQFSQRNNWWSCPTVKSLKENIFRHFTADLSKVPWDLSDESLPGIALSCSVCSSNTANSLLFPDLEQPKCLTPKCFKQKRVLFAQVKLKAIKEGEEDALLLVQSYNRDSSLIKGLIEEGVDIKEVNDYTTVSMPTPPREPEPPTKPEDFDDEEDEGDDLFEQDLLDYEEALQEYPQEVEQYKQDLAEYEDKLNSGLIRKAFLIDSDGELKERLVEPSSGLLKKSAKEGSLNTEADQKAAIVMELSALRTKDKRNKELAFEKVNAHTLELMKGTKISDFQGELSLPEKHGLFVAILSFLGYSAEKELKGIVNLSYRTDNTFQKYDDVVNLTQNPDHQAKILRMFMANHLPMPSTALGINGQSINWAKAKAFMEIARLHFEKEIREVELQEEEKYLKKKSKIDARIEELNSKFQNKSL